MKTNLRRLALLPLLALAFVGCGGSSDDSDPNPFRGTHTGTYDSSLGDNGTINVTISRSGRFEGTIASLVQSGATGEVNGNLTNSGHFTGTVSSNVNNGEFDYEGDLVRNEDGTITGTLNQTDGGQQNATVTFVLGGQVGV